MIQHICKLILKIWGFKITGTVPYAIKKKIYIAMPHTSNWDFLLGILNKGALKLDVKYLAKSSLFKSPFAWFFRMTGGIPVDRSKHNNFVQEVVDVFDKYDTISIALAPEGTRKKVDKLKSGFYYIAMKAKVPIIFVKFDFGKMEVNYSEPFMPTGNYEEDLVKILDHFKGTKGKNPELGFVQ